MDQNKSKILLPVSAAASVLFALILFVFGFVYDGLGFAVALIFIASFVLFVIGAELTYLFFLSRNVKPNHFLFNSTFNVNIPVSKLTFEMIDKKENKE